MNVREENAARALIQGFLKDSVPEYIKDTGQEILNSGGVHKLTIRKEGDTWDVEGIVQGEDFQNYSPHLMLNPETPRFRITATAMKRSWAFAVTWPPPP